MAEAKIRIELDASDANRKLEAFDSKRAKARKRSEAASKRKAQRDQRQRRGGLLGAAAGAAAAARNPALNAIQSRLKDNESKTAAVLKMVAKVQQGFEEIEAAVDLLTLVAGAIESRGAIGAAIAKPIKGVAAEIKKKIPSKKILDQAAFITGAMAPFAAAGIALDKGSIEEINKLAKLQFDNKMEEEVRNKAKVAKTFGNAIAVLSGFGG